MNTSITRTEALTPATRHQVEALVARVVAADGVKPLNEAAHFALEGNGPALHFLAVDQDALVGYAQASVDDHSVQLLVDPARRRTGVATALVKAVEDAVPDPTWWAFGALPGARALAAHIGVSVQRELLVMERDLVAHPAVDEDVPAGVLVRGFTDDDAPALVHTNALAFAHHPEQGAMTLDDFRVRCSEPWFDPAGILVAVDRATGDFLGFHWTKIDTSDPAHPDEPVGEVYVIGVHPDASGRGIGRALLAAGLVHLQQAGALTHSLCHSHK